MSEGRSGERGAALVMALVFTAGLAAAAVAFAEGRRSDALSLRAQVQAVEAEAALESALQQAAALIANRSERQVIPGHLAWRMGTVDVEVTIESEAGKIDLNRAQESLLQGLPLALGAAEDQAAAFAQTVLDWRDGNSERRNQGAEDRDYDGGERGSSGAADRPFAHPAELRYLTPVDPALWARLAPLVTVYSGSSEPNRNKAPETVRRAMAIARGLKPADDSDTDEESSGRQGSSATGDGRLGASAGGSLLGSSGRAGSTFGERDASGILDSGRDAASGTTADGGAGADGGGGTATGEAAGAHTVLLDVRFPNGYEAAAKAVVAFGGGAGGSGAGGSGAGGDGGGGDGRQASPPFTVLDWTPILLEQGGTP